MAIISVIYVDLILTPAQLLLHIDKISQFVYQVNIV